ncbi:MAG: PHP domain-containing protein [Candidatus Omnitrophica bacterium]|nr:PHP domain-containing protein [Candidatus Omnitrophota bacterium]
MSKLADLHIHTYFSDSTDSPQEVVRQAIEKGLSCIAITDHDVLDGIEPTRLAAESYDLEVIPGIELSTEKDKKDIHILGYFLDYQNPQLQAKLNPFQEARVERVKEILKKLKAFGIDNISLEEVCALTKSKAVGRPHVAALLIEKGWAKDMNQAFDKYLADGAAAYVPKWKLSPTEGIELIHAYGGLAVLAHPMLNNKDEIIPLLVKAGLDGLEVYYANAFDHQIFYYEKLARKHKILMTGGSDAHGQAKKHTYIGAQSIPYELIEKMKERVASRQEGAKNVES